MGAGSLVGPTPRDCIPRLPPPIQVFLLSSGAPNIPNTTFLTMYSTPYLTRFPCLLSILMFKRAGRMATHACQYDILSLPPVEARVAVAAELCHVLNASSAALTVNWHEYCYNNSRNASSAEHVEATEHWTGVYFLGTHIALHLSRIGLSGACDVSVRPFPLLSATTTLFLLPLCLLSSFPCSPPTSVQGLSLTACVPSRS